MKNRIATLLTLGTLAGFVVELHSYPMDTLTAITAASAASKMIDPKDGYIYVRFLTSDADMIHANAITPGVGIGYRRMTKDGAMDISIAGNGSDRFRKAYWTFPRASYLHYLTPDKEKSFYAGGGIAWGGVHNNKESDFVGLILNATAGYEFLHNSTALGFMELTVSQPAIPLYREGKFSGPIAEISLGVGF